MAGAEASGALLAARPDDGGPGRRGGGAGARRAGPLHGADGPAAADGVVADDGAFEDRGTYAFPHRRADPPPFEVRARGRRHRRRHRQARAPAHAGRPAVPRGQPARRAHRAARLPLGARAVDRHNLGGARRTVDRVRGGAALDPGLVSRSGWALFDDSAARRLRPRGRLGRAAARAPGLPGLVPVRPRPRLRRRGRPSTRASAARSRSSRASCSAPGGRATGRYSEADVRALVADFRAHDLPLDVFVLDMDWHTRGQLDRLQLEPRAVPRPARGSSPGCTRSTCTRR